MKTVGCSSVDVEGQRVRVQEGFARDISRADRTHVQRAENDEQDFRRMSSLLLRLQRNSLQ